MDIIIIIIVIIILFIVILVVTFVIDAFQIMTFTCHMSGKAQAHAACHERCLLQAALFDLSASAACVGVHDSGSHVHQCAGGLPVRPLGHLLCHCLCQHPWGWPQLLASKASCQGKHTA